MPAPFYTAEVETYRPGGVATYPAFAPNATVPNGTLETLGSPVAAYDTVRGSDLGYRTRQADPGGVVVYPPLLQSAFSISRALQLAPGGQGAGYAWGSVVFANPDGRFSALAGANNSDGRPVTIRTGVKVFDPSRGIDVDPPVSALTTVFAGLALPWFLSNDALTIPLRDASYWLERPVQTVLYGGTGGLDGGADLAGLPKPMARGGTVANPIRNVPAVRVDAVNRIWQWTDGSGELVSVYEGGLSGFAFAGDVADLYSGSTPVASYRTNKARGLFQLGSAAQRTITVDCTGNFTTPAAGSVSTIGGLLLWLLVDDMRIPAASVDTANVSAFGTAAGYTAGVWTGTETVDGVTLLGRVANSVGAKVYPARGGRLKVAALRAVPGGTTPAARYGAAEIVNLLPRALGTPLDPPPFRWRVGYQQNYAPGMSDVAPTVTDTRRAFMGAAFRYALKSSNAVLAAFNRPSDPDPVNGVLLVQAEAQAVADALDALWSGTARRRLYDVELPLALGVRHDIGDVLGITWPIDNLPAGPLGQVVGEQFRSGDATVTLTVLV